MALLVDSPNHCAKLGYATSKKGALVDWRSWAEDLFGVSHEVHRLLLTHITSVAVYWASVNATRQYSMLGWPIIDFSWSLFLTNSKRLLYCGVMMQASKKTVAAMLSCACTPKHHPSVVDSFPKRL